MLQKDLIAKFISLGLSQYESQVLFSVYSLGRAKATDISEHSEVPKAKIYDILNLLCNKRLIRMHATKPMTYSPIDPGKFFDALESWEDEKAKKTKRKIKEQKVNSLGEIKSLFEKNKTIQPHQELIEIIRLGEPSHFETRNIINKAKEEICLVTEAFEFLPSVEKELDEAIKRKVSINIILSSSKNIKKENLAKYGDAVKKLKEKKVNLKFSDELFHLRYALNDPDNKTLCGCVLVVKEYDVPLNLRNAVFSRNISFVKGLKNHFNYFWQKSNH